MERNLIVLDNFLDDPDKIRHCALSLDFDRVQKNVPGTRSCRVGGDVQTEVEDKLKSAPPTLRPGETPLGNIKIPLIIG